MTHAVIKRYIRCYEIQIHVPLREMCAIFVLGNTLIVKYIDPEGFEILFNF